MDRDSFVISLEEDGFSEEEADIFRRGRNAKTHFTPKHGDAIQYRRATGFEALMGYLHISGQEDRRDELMEEAMRIISGAEGKPSL